MWGWSLETGGRLTGYLIGLSKLLLGALSSCGLRPRIVLLLSSTLLCIMTRSWLRIAYYNVCLLLSVSERREFKTEDMNRYLII